jgi:hypothetical protein
MSLKTYCENVNAILDRLERTMDSAEPAPPPEPTARRSNWAPLITLVGEGLARDFMFMAEVDGLMLYKHVNTRKYLNVDRITGKTYRFVPAKDLNKVKAGLARYEPIPTYQAISEVLS